MKKNNKIINRCISILILIIYLFGSSYINTSHNHADDENHQHHQDLLICENDIHCDNTSDCSHNSHVINSEESCPTCIHFSNCKSEILDNIINITEESLNLDSVQLITSIFLIDVTNTQNKSPPFIV